MQENSIKITVGIPVYNAEKSIQLCMDSVIKALEKVKQYEIICVDDGSLDKSAQIIKEKYCRNYNVRLIQQDNKGPFFARDYVIGEAKGEWIGFVDADDTIEEDMYSTMIERAESSANMDMIVCAFQKIDYIKCNFLVQMNKFGNAKYDFEKNPQDRGIMAAVNPAYWNKLYRRTAIQNRVKLAKSPRIMEDLIFYSSVMPFIRAISFVEKPLYNYNNIEFSVTKQIGKNELEEAKDGVVSLLNHFKQYNISDEYIWNLISLLVCMHLGIAFSINWTESLSSLKEVHKSNIDFLNTYFPEWNRNIYLEREYLQYRPQLKKTYLAFTLFKTQMWSTIVRIYKVVCNILGNDIKW